MDFIAANSVYVGLLAVILLLFIYELYFKPQKDDDKIDIVESYETIDTTKLNDKLLDKEIQEAVKIAIKLHREKANG